MPFYGYVKSLVKNSMSFALINVQAVYYLRLIRPSKRPPSLHLKLIACGIRIKVRKKLSCKMMMSQPRLTTTS